MTAAAQPKHVSAGEIWLFLYRVGGWWRPVEIGRALGIGRNVNPRVLSMKAVGTLERHPMGMAKYGVTAACKVPAGVTLEQITEAAKGAAP